MPIAKALDHAQAIIDALEALGLTVGDAQGETAAGVKLTPPYAVVYDVSDTYSGTLADPHGYAELVYQVTCVGKLPAQARAVRDKAMGLVNGFNVTGRDIVLVVPEGPTRILRDNDVSPPLFYCTPRFRIFSDPS